MEKLYQSQINLIDNYLMTVPYKENGSICNIQTVQRGVVLWVEKGGNYDQYLSLECD